MTIVITYIGGDNAKNRYRARRAAKRDQEYETKKLSRRKAVAESGCSSSRVERAVNSAPNWRIQPDPVDGAMCLPDVAIFVARYRKTDVITAQ